MTFYITKLTILGHHVHYSQFGQLTRTDDKTMYPDASQSIDHLQKLFVQISEKSKFLFAKQPIYMFFKKAYTKIGKKGTLT